MLSFFRTCLLALALLPAAAALGQTARWANSTNGPNDDYPKSVAVDAAGNTYAGGTFVGSTTIGSTALSAGGVRTEAAFVAKYSPTGAVLWVRPLAVSSQAGFVRLNGIAVDASGAVVLTGNFNDGSLPIGNITLPANSSTTFDDEGFVAKISATGTTLWAAVIPNTSGVVNAGAIATDAAGAVYVAGMYDEQIPFVAKYSATGALQFSVNAPGTTDSCYIGSLAVSANGQQLAITGSLAGSTLTLAAAAGGRPAVEVVSPSANSVVGFVAGFSAAGVAQWAQPLGAGSAPAFVYSVEAAGSDFVVCGFYGAAATFGTAPAIPLATGTGLMSGMVARLSATGVVQWVQSIGGNEDVYAYDVALDGAGNVQVGGTFSGQLNATGRNLLSAGDADLYFLAYSGQGALRGGQRDGGVAYDDFWGFALDAANQPHVVGSYTDAATSVAGVALPAATNYDGFIAKLAATPLAARTAVLPSAALTAAPNPAHPGDAWQLTLDATLTTAPATLRVMNVLGQEVRRHLLPTGSTTLTVPTAGLPAGRYVLQVMGATAVATRAVVLE